MPRTCLLLLAVLLVSSSAFAQAEDFDSIKLYTLKNENGMTVKVTNYGAIITAIVVPDRNGKMADVTLGYNRSCDGDLHYGAGHSVLLRQLSGRSSEGQIRQDLCASRWILFGNATLSRQSESTKLSVNDSEARIGIQDTIRIQVQY